MEVVEEIKTSKEIFEDEIVNDIEMMPIESSFDEMVNNLHLIYLFLNNYIYISLDK